MSKVNYFTSGVTVGIPFYAGTNQEYFCSAVDSILNQTLLPDEIHLIQDGLVSKELEKIVQEYMKNDSKIKHILIPENRGLPYALNLSIISTSTCYYARMDDDDISHPDRLKKQVEFLEKNPPVDILGTWALEFENDPNIEECFIRKVPSEITEIRRLFHYRNPITHPSVMFRRSVFAKLGLYDAKFGVYCDLGMWAKALKLNIGIGNLPEALLYYRTKGVVRRRALGVVEQAKARYEYNTWSPQLNLLKIISLLFRFMPYHIQE